MNRSLVSIIIPTYNRALLIGETLDSIMAQTYTNWECIVVDDGSTDETDIVMKNYCAKDTRFKYFKRPTNRQRGGNAARNYGFELSSGEAIQWFDSDDLMTNTMIEQKVGLLSKENADVVISQTKYFNRPNFNGYTYTYTTEDINFLNYATGTVSWFTPDIMVRREIVASVKFNEMLKAGQEYNFCCKLLLKTEKIAKLDSVTTLRRFHNNSIGRKRQKDAHYYWLTKFESHWQTYLDTHEEADSQIFNEYSLLKCTLSYLESGNSIPLPNKFKSEIKCVFHKRYMYFQLACWSNAIFNKYHFFYEKLKRVS